ncbi:MAG TPA: transcriptional repressor [Gammaproteobacteria bacterium]|nr:transcriptional repressor [Gammaproteobacteria bacterium]
MNTTEQIIDRAEQRCNAHGARLTHKRKKVLSGLLQSDKALSAYELMDYCNSEFGENIPAMSVYRILDFLQEEQLVHKLKLANKFVACAHISCDHAHGVPQFLICGECQRVKEVVISQSIINQLQQSVSEAGFHLRSPQLEMDSLCECCVGNAA